MKRVLVVAACAAALAGCAGTPISEFTHADLKNAASIASAHGVPARAAVWSAIDSRLTADEAVVSAVKAQAAACKEALANLKPAAPTGTVGAATLLESGAELVSAGVPATVKSLCEPIPIPGLLIKF